MEGQVQQFVTLRFGDLWLDVPIAPLVAAVSKSLETTAASPAKPEEKEVSSTLKEGFTHVLTKSAKRRMRAAARASKDQHVREASSSTSVPPGFTKMSPTKVMSHEVPPNVVRMTPEEWPVLAKRTGSLKVASPRQSASTTSTKVVVPLTPSKLRVGAREGLGESSHKIIPSNVGATQRACSTDKGKGVMAEDTESSSLEGSARPRNQLRVDAPEFIPTMGYNPIEPCLVGEPSNRRSLQWQGVFVTSDDFQASHVDPTATISDPLSSSVPAPRPSFEGSIDPACRRRRRQRAHRAWLDFPVATDANMTNQQRKQVAYPIRNRERKINARIRGGSHASFHAVMTQNVCQALKEVLPGCSISADNVGDAIMRCVETLSKWPEYEEFVKADPRRQEYVKQAAHARKKRAALKQREMEIRADSGYSRIQGKDSPSTSQVSRGNGAKEMASTENKTTRTLAPWPTRKKVSGNSFEVFNAMPVGVKGVTDNSSETSSASIHFKRKKACKTVVEGPCRTTWSQKGSDHEELGSSNGGSYNPLSDSTPCPSENEIELHHGAEHTEQVLAANETRPVEEQLANLTAALQQKEDELAAL
ncbi:hypothetical protein CFC21_035467 [Triticum aestivum]|uniref:Uncharacterized protein n=2 Tax=Triticum aestivum TaxID=4565 RepID=A0A3B6EG73_WHEAT|nr:hypothetical protein CFC21_035467 [Triticum aestivum]